MKVRRAKSTISDGGLDAKIDFRMPRMQVGEPRREPLLQERRERRDIDRAALTLLPDLLQGRLHSSSPRRRPGSSRVALESELHPAAIAAQEWRLQVVLQRLDLLADRGRVTLSASAASVKFRRVATASNTRSAFRGSLS